MRNLLILAAILLIASGATAQETARLFTATTFSATDSPSGEPRKPKAQPPQSAQQKAQAGEEALPATAPAAGQTAGTGGTDKRGERNKRDGRFIQSYKVMLFKKPEGKEQAPRPVARRPLGRSRHPLQRAGHEPRQLLATGRCEIPLAKFQINRRNHQSHRLHPAGQP